MTNQKKTFSTDKIIALAATVTSICALIVTVYQTKLTREQQLNSVWPYVITFESIDEKQLASIMVANYGIGPAIIDSIQVRYKGQKFTSFIDLVKEISIQNNRGPLGMSFSQDGIRHGLVIPQGQIFVAISINGKEDNALFRQELKFIQAVIYYHSIYSERWHSTYNLGEEMVIKD